MSGRKKKHEEHENHERWLVSYADFITLLFAFFVVMYSISSVNEGKYRVLSDSLVAAFRSSARSLAPIQQGELARSPITPLSEQLLDRPTPNLMQPILINVPGNVLTEAVLPEEFFDQELPTDGPAGTVEAMAAQIETAMTRLIDENLISIRRNQFYLEIELNSAFLFGSGSAELSIDAEVILKQIALVLAKQPNRIHVEGYTDNIPVSAGQFPSNWELSAARAAAVVRLFAANNIASERMAAIGHGEQKPAESNSTEAGRRKNRRVVIVVLNHLDESTNVSETATYELMKDVLQRLPFWVN
jgi:chemotaxis protein MotB